MKIVEMHGESRVGLVNAPVPEPHDNWVVVKVTASTICGTEARTYQYGDSVFSSHSYNSGHEAAGIVWKAGPTAKVAEGARVAVLAHMGEQCGNCIHCYQGLWLLCPNIAEGGEKYLGTHAQYIARPDSHCIPIPDDVSFEMASILVDAVGTPYRAIRRLGVNGLDTVLITGLGPLGASASIICERLGARVIASEPAEFRRRHAHEYGVEVVLDPMSDDVLAQVMELTDGRGVDVALDFTGYAEPQVLCLDAAKVGGAVGFIGLKYDETPDGPVPRPTPVTVAGHLLPKELTLIGSWSITPQELLELIELVQRGLPLEQLITHRFGIDEAQEAYETAFNQRGCKVIIDPWGES